MKSVPVMELSLSPDFTSISPEENGPSSIEAQMDPNELVEIEDQNLLNSPIENTCLEAVTECFLNVNDNEDTKLVRPTSEALDNSKLEFVSSDNAVGGICGFSNFANTCYLNSGLHCLFATPPVVVYFKRCMDTYSDSDGTISEELPRLISSFGLLLNNFWSGTFRAIKPINFKNVLANIHNQFEGAQQHDCQEFLALLLDSLHEDLVRLNYRNPSHAMEDRLVSSPSLSRNGPTIESRADSASPSSFDSHSSSVTSSIRRLQVLPQLVPLPPKRSPEREELNLNLTSSSDPPAKRRFCGPFSKKDSGSKVLAIQDYIKDTKLLNLNVSLVDICANNSEERMNNEQLHNFNSEKCSTFFKQKPPKTSNAIDNKLTVYVGEDWEMTQSSDPHLETPDSLQCLAKSPSSPSAKNSKCQKSFKDINILHEAESSSPESLFFNNSTTDFCHVKNDLDEKCSRHNTYNQDLLVPYTSSCRSSDSKHCGPDESNLKLIPNHGEFDEDDDDDGIGSSTSNISFCGGESNSSNGIGGGTNEYMEADQHWNRYVSQHDSIIARSFQGQFKNSIICSKCHHVSVSFEPFMYLTLPLPVEALRIQVELVLILRNRRPPTRYLINMTHSDSIHNVKERIVNMIMRFYKIDDVDVDDLQAVETSSSQSQETPFYKIQSQLEDWKLVRNFGGNLSLCLVQVLQINAADIESEDETSNIQVQTSSCIICLEDLPLEDLRRHISCHCVMCESCIERTVLHAERTSLDGHFKCPQCMVMTRHQYEFVSLVPSVPRSTLPPITIKIIFRYKITPFGHSTLIRLPYLTSGYRVYSAIREYTETTLSGSNLDFSLDLVDPSGINCSRCLRDCNGCIRLYESGAILGNKKIHILKSTDCIGVTFQHNCEVRFVDLDESLGNDEKKSSNVITLNDCIKAFSQSENLDESNPWYCPACRNHQCATKTLSVWRFPDYLIIYIKRFVYINNEAIKLDNKITFCVNNLNFSFNLTKTGAVPHPTFDLYGLVCHFGSAGGGHYTSFSRHISSDKWNYFDDAKIIEDRVPGTSEDDYSAAYILFYRKKGISCLKANQVILSRNFNKFYPQRNMSDVGNLDMVNEDNYLEPLEPDLHTLINTLATPPPSL